MQQATQPPDLIAAYEKNLRDLNRSAATIRTYIPVLRRMDAEISVGLSSACTEELQDWINAGNRSQATRALYRATAGGFFRWACGLGEELDFDSAELLPTVSVPQRPARAIADELLYSILARAQRPHLDWYTIAACTGARCIEISNLDREDITKEQVWIHGKGRKDRLVPTHPLIWQMAQQLPAGPIAVDADGSRLDRRQISQRGNHYLAKLVADVTMHDLRRWFGTRTYEASGCDIRAVQELLGHAQVNTTQRYIATSARRKAAAVAGLPLAA